MVISSELLATGSFQLAQHELRTTAKETMTVRQLVLVMQRIGKFDGCNRVRMN
jgi:hypothetical protein